jgi:hypothetical protein
MAFLIIFGVGIFLTVLTFVLGDLFDLGGAMPMPVGRSVRAAHRRSAPASCSSS